ncbi:hypothetical protein [Synechocystis sp. PCC 7509]|uniref:hypothetical protein n=1 Tax=Synechocystis sp. PCC 7509 TaxID=927677 RepID=UPI0002AC547A|nr:hypothetical protein [Synechocystis sp. PCC 7509]
MQKNIATSPVIKAPQTQLIIPNKNSPSQHQLVAVWQLDENSKLYCQWVEQNSSQ